MNGRSNAGRHRAAAWVLAAVLASLTGLPAQEPAPAAGEGDVTGEAPDGIDSTIELRDELAEDPRRRSLFPSWYESYRQFRERGQERLGIETALSYDVLGQGYASADESFGAASGDLTLTGRWTPFKRRAKNPLSLGFRVRHRHAIGGLDAPSQIQNRAPLLWGTVDGFSDQGFKIPDFYITQTFLTDRLELRYGQVTTSNIFDTHRMGSSKRYFLNQAFSANPAVAFPSSGAGLFARWKSPRGWDFTIGGSNVQGTLANDDVSWKIDSDSIFFGAQLGFDFEAYNGPPGRLQLFVWSSDALPDGSQGAGKGWSLTYEHVGVPRNGRLFLRYARANSDPTKVDHLVSAGFGMEVRGFDFWGVGAGAGRASHGGADWQGVFELFYRWQATRELTVTPDVQFIAGEVGEGEPFQVVAGLRGGLTF